MTKKIILTAILFLVFIALTAIIVFGLQKREIEKKQAEQQKQQEIERQQKEQQNSENQNIFSQEELEEIERLKNDPNLVWYEVPELGIRFRVTPDTKEDLGYSFNSNEEYKGLSSVVFYSYGGLSNGNYEQDCVLSENGWSCGRAMLLKISEEYFKQYSEKYGRDLCINASSNDLQENIIILDNMGRKDGYICFNYTMPNIELVINDLFYKNNFYKKEKDNLKFAIYLNTIEQLQK